VGGKGTEFAVYLTIADPSVQLYYGKSQEVDDGVLAKVIILLCFEII
jgi:hypothetical protein